eukprot:jgi/Tetstr1/432512/TSEL_021886.t1
MMGACNVPFHASSQAKQLAYRPNPEYRISALRSSIIVICKQPPVACVQRAWNRVAGDGAGMTVEQPVGACEPQQLVGKVPAVRVVPVTVRMGQDHSTGTNTATIIGAASPPEVEVESYPLANISLDDAACVEEEEDCSETAPVPPPAAERRPSAKEEAAARAARARLYGEATNGDEASAGAAPVDRPPVLPSGPEPVAVDVEYVERGDLAPPGGDPGAAADAAVAGLASPSWPDVVTALNALRAVAVHAPAALAPRLPAALPALLKCVKSLRSSVCKTALLAVGDLLASLSGPLLPMLDGDGPSKPGSSLLCQLLLKAASNDKRFVVEEAARCLAGAAECLPPAPLAGLLEPYAAHRNPKLRAAAAAALADALAQLPTADLAAWHPDGLPGALCLVGALITDKTPVAREAARAIAALVRAAFDCRSPGTPVRAPFDNAAPLDGEEEPPPPTPWEAFCREHLAVSPALAVLKATAEAQ